MFKKSLLLVALVFTVVFASAFASQMVITGSLPSAYDSGLSIEKAFKTSHVPLLIEFYSDSCGTCKRMAPIVHDLHEKRYQNRLTTVMMDVDDPSNRDIAQLFGVDALPAIFVFDHHHMKKFQIPSEAFVSRGRLQKAIDGALAKTEVLAKTPNRLPPAIAAQMDRAN